MRFALDQWRGAGMPNCEIRMPRCLRRGGCHGPMWFRAQHSAQMLAEDKQISFEEMVKDKHSTHMELAERLLDDLIPAARQQGGELAHRAADVLDVWDRQADADSRGSVLFAFWAEELDFAKCPPVTSIHGWQLIKGPFHPTV